MTTAKKEAAAALKRARANEEAAFQALAHAAMQYARVAKRDVPRKEADDLRAAAKKYTNAMHQRSRCEKHKREA